MKRILTSVALGTALIISSCTEEKAPENNDSQALQTITAEDAVRDSLMNSILKTTQFINEIDDSLSVLTGQVSSVTSQGEGTRSSYEENIKRKISLLSAQIAEQRQALDKAQKDRNLLAKDNSRLAKQMDVLKLTIDELQKLIASKEDQILALTAQIEVLTGERDIARNQRDSISTEYTSLTAVKDQIAKEKRQQEETAWFIIGTSQELKQKGFTWHNTGFLGAGGNLLPGTTVDKEAVFTKINIFDVTSIKLPAPIEKIHSAHAAKKESYSASEKELTILNPKNFWAGERFLIIEIED
jgi:septal ring factor EnvC (AmiA/AmiB activator)